MQGLASYKEVLPGHLIIQPHTVGYHIQRGLSRESYHTVTYGRVMYLIKKPWAFIRVIYMNPTILGVKVG